MQHFLSWLTQFSYTQTGNFPNDFIPLNEICKSDTPKLATFMTILCFWLSDVIFTPRFARFLTNLWLEKDMQFLSENLAFSGYPWKKGQYQPTQHAFLLQKQQTSENRKKIDLRKNSANTCNFFSGGSVVKHWLTESWRNISRKPNKQTPLAKWISMMWQTYLAQPLTCDGEIHRSGHPVPAQRLWGDRCSLPSGSGQTQSGLVPEPLTWTQVRPCMWVRAPHAHTNTTTVHPQNTWARSMSICVHMCANTHACVHAHVHTHTHTHVHEHTHTHHNHPSQKHTSIYVHRCANIHAHANTHTYTHTHTHTHIYTHTQTYMNTHTHTHFSHTHSLTLSLSLSDTHMYIYTSTQTHLWYWQNQREEHALIPKIKKTDLKSIPHITTVQMSQWPTFHNTNLCFFHELITQSGAICFKKKKIHLTHSGWILSILRTEVQLWAPTFEYSWKNDGPS